MLTICFRICEDADVRKARPFRDFNYCPSTACARARRASEARAGAREHASNTTDARAAAPPAFACLRRTHHEQRAAVDGPTLTHFGRPFPTVPTIISLARFLSDPSFQTSGIFLVASRGATCPSTRRPHVDKAPHAASHIHARRAATAHERSLTAL